MRFLCPLASAYVRGYIFDEYSTTLDSLMAKTLSESPLTTRNARASLPMGLHWRRIDLGRI